MTTLKENKSVKKPLSEEAKKKQAAKARATRHRHKMETLYSEYQVDLLMEEKAMWEQKPEEEKEETVLQWGTALEKREKRQHSCIPNCCHGKGGGKGTSDNEEEGTDDVATVGDIDEGGDKKPTAKTLTADSRPENNNEDGTNNDGDGNNKNDNDDENENEDDNGNEENENEDEDENEDEKEDENPSPTKNNPTPPPPMEQLHLTTAPQ
jgi:cobalamin biosynthesis protein CobT